MARPISFRPPAQWTYEVVGVVERPGDSKERRSKRATLTNGVHIEVPEFVGVGERVVVDIAERAYVKRE